MSTTLIIVLAVIAILILSIALWCYSQKRGARKFDERWEKMSEAEKRAFQQRATSTKLG